MKKKYILLGIIASILAVSLVYKNVSTKNSVVIPNDNQVEVESKVELIIDFGNNEPKKFNLNITSTDTAFSVLKASAEKENIILQVKQYDFGVFVEKIGDFESSAKKSWIYYVNGESGQIAADQQKLKNGDKIEWKYEIPK